MEQFQHLYASDGEVDDRSVKIQTLPIPLHVKYGGSDPWIDRPEKHCARVRSFPHFQGNYPSSLYIRSVFKHDAQYQDLNLVPEEDRHISLTKTFTLRKHEIQPLLSAVASVVGDMVQFQVSLQKFAVFINEERTRTFLSLLVSNPEQVESIIAKIDHCMERFGLPVYYNPAIAHSTFAWIAGDHYRAIAQLIDSLTDGPIVSVQVQEIYAKIGDKEYSIPLKVTI